MTVWKKQCSVCSQEDRAFTVCDDCVGDLLAALKSLRNEVVGALGIGVSDSIGMSVLVVYKLIDRIGEPYEEDVLEWFVFYPRARRALLELGPRKHRDTMLDGSPRYVIREHVINSEAA
jgi:hypothetical protein